MAKSEIAKQLQRERKQQLRAEAREMRRELSSPNPLSCREQQAALQRELRREEREIAKTLG